MTCVQPYSLARAGLLGRADGADGGGAQVPRPLAGDEADAAGGRMQQQRRALADLVGLAQQVAHRHALQHHGGAGLVVDAVGQLDEPVGGHHPLLGVAAHGARIGAAVADLEVGHAGAHGHDLAGSLRAGHERRRHLVEARALIDVDVVDAHGMLLERTWPGPGAGTSTLSHFITSGPPAWWMRMAWTIVVTPYCRLMP